MNPTAIQWTWRRGEDGELVPKTGSTWNPLLGCRRISPGCENCYAERLISTRLSKHKHYLGIAKMTEKGPRFTGETRFVVDRLTDPLRATKGRNVFVCDLSDLFFEGNTFEQIAAVYGIMALARHHTFQVLTKRPRRAVGFYDWVDARGAELGLDPFSVCTREARRVLPAYRPLRAKNLQVEHPWPLWNVQVGVSVEDQKRANERIPLLLKMPAALRFLSVEPLLEKVDLSDLVVDGRPGAEHHIDALRCEEPGEDEDFGGRTIDWVIVGGESGPNARPFDLAWARSIVEQCRVVSKPCFVKQLGAKPVHMRREDEEALVLSDSHGGDPAEWPEDLRVRQLAGEVAA